MSLANVQLKRKIQSFPKKKRRTRLRKIEKKEMALATISDCKKLADVILLRLAKELGADYPWMPEAFHFVVNPMLVSDKLWFLALS